MTMSSIAQTIQPSSLPDRECYPPFRMSIDQYEKLVESGVFTKRDKAQLIHGILVQKVTSNPPHAVSTELCDDELSRVSPAGWHVRSEKPVKMPPDSEPEPDVCLVHGAHRDYSSGHPNPADIGLLVEIADSSLVGDRRMARTFGANNIPIYWIVNLVDRQIEVYASPAVDGYTASQIYKPGEMVPVVLDGVEVGRISVVDILP
jgi:Uma2 family endonuclease